MARGYSVSRSKSQRPTLRLKRERSASIHKLRQELQQRGDSKIDGEPNKCPKRTHPDIADASLKEGKAKSSTLSTSRSQTLRVLKQRKVEDGEDADRIQRLRSASVVSSQLRARLAVLEADLEEDMEASEDESETVYKAEVMAKYRAAGQVVDEVLDVVSRVCVAGANVKELCDLGDTEITTRLKGLFTKSKDERGKKIAKGISYPTNISIDDVLCNYLPFRSEEAAVLRGAQVVKIHLGCHIDGYPASAARTVVVPYDREISARSLNEEQEEKDNEAVKARIRNNAAVGHTKESHSLLNHAASHAIEAARVALLGLTHLLRPGTLNADLTDFIASVGGHYGVEAVEGVLSNRTKRWVLDGVDCIINRRIVSTTPQQDVADCKVQPYQVWTLDVAFTNNNTYRLTQTIDMPSIFRRTAEDFPCDARVKHANQVLKEITDSHFCFPFHFKSLSEPLRSKMGINVLARQGAVDPFPCLRAKGGRCVTARFSATVAVTKKRITVLCGLPPAQSPLSSDSALRPKEMTEAMKTILFSSMVLAHGLGETNSTRDDVAESEV
ncbi:unnamed protein product [Phytomonas sp. Hart1]|nr:unnamed protein product [Phytomonas sp. Hart1]|eukprot:CCW66822.1 unnamed protein product [Phytomonas sp. isolate Hart1]